MHSKDENDDPILTDQHDISPCSSTEPYDNMRPSTKDCCLKQRVNDLEDVCNDFETRLQKLEQK